MAITKTVTFNRVAVDPGEIYASMVIFETVVLDDPGDSFLPVSNNNTRSLAAWLDEELSPPAWQFPDVTGEEQLIQDIASGIWP